MAEKRASRKPKSPGVFGHPSKQAQTKRRVGLYARVSTHDQQTIPLQNPAMREYATRRGWKIALQVKLSDAGMGRPIASISLRLVKIYESFRRKSNFKI
jgi:hypothetical protein